MSSKLYKDKAQRVLYSTDISMFEILPSGVFFPKNQKEVETLLRQNALSNEKLTIHARGAGTGTAGQSLGNGIIIDFSRYMNQIIETRETYVDVEPGIILGDLNQQLKTIDLFVPVDPSSGDVCTVGGMVANNSSGIHSYLYGDTKDYVSELEGFWADGSFFSTYTEKNILHFKEKFNDLASRSKGLEDKLPRTLKNSSGYNIKNAFNSEPYTMNSFKQALIQLIVGSEGTLSVITKIRLKTIPFPKKRITILSLFDDFEKALDAVNMASKVKGISAIELLDSELIEASKEYYPEMRPFFSKDSKAGLLFEIDGDDAYVRKQYLELEKILSYLAIKTELAIDEEKREQLWRIRRSASSILNRIEGSTRSLRFIEDVCVPLDSIIDFYHQEKDLLDKYGLRTAFFGHIGSGHFHINPRIDTRDPNFWDIVEKISEKTYELVSKLGGTLDAEHGDGILREPYIKKFQPELYKIYFDIKNLFDPSWILNPGKIVSKTDYRQPLDNVRYIFTSDKTIDRQTLNEVEKCHGCNECLHFCESYKSAVSMDEGYKSRGRANLMRAIVSGVITEKELNSALKYIDECKLCGNCAKECPTGIDIIKTASILREKGIMPLRTKEKFLMILYSPYKRLLIWNLSRHADGSNVKINIVSGMFRLGLYYIPYLKDLAQIINKKNLQIETNIAPLKIYLERYNTTTLN
ncbi:MAG: FAD-binding and (Fe-S)-binding domain-containing protein [bacterium]